MELRSGPMIAYLSANASIRKPGRFAFSVSAGSSSYRDRTATHRTLDHARVLAASLAGDHVSQLLLACNLLTMHLADTSTTPAFPAPVRRSRKRGAA
jgi:hypothetical protein